ncbi:HAMP domain-containing histidine kinase [Alkalihalobacillus hwajinpoensis]|uniref:sensor histidine kinase n=1 Tax=Guptibacillus hwajinpoensis TaxID=208199 RepID=UPI00188344AE|nr:HAMP domain-containing sensor histidine kinase [Pseudalkalibacillus hwajinpoensis]MBF0705816.1 HAMP domain-containing histidine kinase [Pseudalkalibacillus hwajinpoensis]
MKSLYSKFLLTTLFIMIISSLIGFLFANTLYQTNLKPENDTKNTEIATRIAEYAESQESLERFLEHTSSTGYQLFLVNGQGEKRFFGGTFNEENLSHEEVKKVLNGDIYHGMKEFPKATFVTGFFANELKNSVGVPLSYNGNQYALFMRPNIKLLFNEIHILLGWMAVATVILSLIAVLIWAVMIIHPIRKLSHATNIVGEEGFNVQLDIHRKDEIGQLTQNFNEMISRLGKLDKLRKSFVSNVSHDIQTPLLNIQGYSRLLENDALTEKEKRSYLNVIQDETKRMSILTKQLLTLSSLDPKENTLSKERVELSGQFSSLLQRYYWLINEENLSLTYSLDDVTVKGNADLLYTVWENLLTNAIKYNKPGGAIQISLENAHEQIEITFRDTGIGLGQSEKEQIFDRFYRADLARTRTKQGTGLGLSIVKQIVELHGGHINVDSQKNKGTTFKVVLPYS